jgi:hypothetical protein
VRLTFRTWRVCCRALVPAAVTVILVIGVWVQSTPAATSRNPQSPLGINLSVISYWSSELPFLDLMHMSKQWITHTNSNDPWDTNEEQYLDLDADGWPKTLTAVNDPKPQQFTSVGVVLLFHLSGTTNGYYPAGRYVVLYDGQGTLTYGFDADVVSRSPGRDVINVARPTASGIDIRMTATDPKRTGNYLRNVRVVKAENEGALAHGEIFNPAFLALTHDFRALRFMDWFATNRTTLSTWSARPLPSNAFWGTTKGVPLEVAVQLANALSADPWLNVPHTADDNYISQMAALVHSHLGKSQKVYVELSNEVWNGIFPQYDYAVNQGHALWPHQPGGGGGYEWNRNWYGMRVAQMCDLWKSAWGGDASRVVCVLAAQASVPNDATEALKCRYWDRAPCSAHKIDAIAIAPYFGFKVPSAWTSQADGGLAFLFKSLYSQNDPSIPPKGSLGLAAQWEAAYMAELAPYKLPLIAYEGGQSFANGSDALNRLYIAANRDPRMRTAYATYLTQWKASGAGLMMLYNDIYAPDDSGSWGALESIMQTTTPLSSAPPKWQAIQEFIASNPCWWSGCSGAVSSTTTVLPASEAVGH